MKVPVPHTWIDGLWSAGDANKYIRDVAEFFMNVPMCIVRRDKRSLSLRGTIIDLFEFDTVIHDNDAIYENSPSGTLVPQTPGVYLINWTLQWKITSGAVADSLQHWSHIKHFDISKTLLGEYYLYVNEFLSTDETNTSQLALPFSAGDYIELRVTTLGASDDEFKICGYDTTNGEYGSQLEIRWIRPL